MTKAAESPTVFRPLKDVTVGGGIFLDRQTIARLYALHRTFDQIRSKAVHELLAEAAEIQGVTYPDEYDEILELNDD